MSDFESELLGLAEDDPGRSRKKRSHAAKKVKSKAYVDDSEGSDMDMDLESEEGDSSPVAPLASTSRPKSNPYPLEGKYINEADRDELEAMPEIDREEVLATRLEEMQKYKDSAQLDAMYKMAGMGAGEEESDDEPTRKKRKHTSVTKETSKAISDLKSRRKAKDERAQRRALRREQRPRSSSPGSHHSHSTEDGEISLSNRDTYRDYLTLAKKEPEEKKEKDLDALPANRIEVNSARLSRYELVDLLFKAEFAEVVRGAYVRLMAADKDEMGRPKYRIHKVTGEFDIDTKHSYGRYKIEYKGRDVMDDRALVCQYGNATRHFRIADVSNGDFEDVSLGPWKSTLFMAKHSYPDRVFEVHTGKPGRQSVAAKEIRSEKQTRSHPGASRSTHDGCRLTSSSIGESAHSISSHSQEEINRQVESRKKSNPAAIRNKAVLEISSLMSSRGLALRRNDSRGVELIDAQIRGLGGDPATGQMVEEEKEMSEYDARIAKINENNKRKTKENQLAAHNHSLMRKKAEIAIVKARSANNSHQNSPAPEAEKKAAPPSGLKHGETAQEYLARTIDLDLDDF
ncbi:RNA polymerase-associated protein RTF1, partial [Tremellales sp. Uapishka_1]